MLVPKLFSVALLAASTVTEAMAAKCTAKGEMLGSWMALTRTITITTGDSTFRYNMDNHEQTICGDILMQTSEPSNLKRVKGHGTPASPVVWNAHCAGTTWKWCNVDYQDQKNVEGTLGDKTQQRYRSCTVEFDC
ncbi:hypothetical protein PHISP_03270 [Aspergillus sp. HF37]|nr:hypothetical protein PHISP_03270 [Aspergillus sp. HF37]